MKVTRSLALDEDQSVVGVAAVRHFLSTAVDLSTFALRAFRAAIQPPWDIRAIDLQLYEVGWRSSILVFVVGLALGITISQFISASLAGFGTAETVIPTRLSKMMFRQLGPLITGLLVSGRIAAAMTAELGVLGLEGQIHEPGATKGNSNRNLIVTRMVACGVALPILSILMCFAEIFGGYLWEMAGSGTSSALYFGRVFETVTWSDYLLPTLATGVAGVVIAVISCYFGLTTDTSALGIRRASMQSVVLCCLFVVALNLSSTEILFVWLPGNAR